MKQENIETLKRGGIGIIPTDTIYGVVGLANSPGVIERIKKLKNRSENKGFIILISSVDDLKQFGITLSEVEKEVLTRVWPGKVSVALTSDKSFRLPADRDLVAVLKQTGPLIAPSANPEGMPPAKNIKEAVDYFSDRVDFYEDGGGLVSEPSTIISITGGKVKILRRGVVEIK